MRKHAYLIKAHHQFGLLKKLLILIDDDRNDIFVHIEKGADYEEWHLDHCVKKSKIYFVEPIKETWGGFSQIESELILFKTARKHRYEYYHLLSGVDLPLKTQDEIHDFFEKNSGKEFIHFCSKNFVDQSKHKYERYHILQEKIGRDKRSVCYFLEKALLFLQSILNVKRAENIDYYMGANWVSITHELVEYIVEQEDYIRKLFHSTLCCDEFFIQTLVGNSHFLSRVFSTKEDYYSCLRLIDWERGNPYIWREDDYLQLVTSPHFFARKFDETVDNKIIEKLYNYVKDAQDRV